MSLRLLFSTVCLSCFLSSSREVLKFVNAVLQDWISLTSNSKSLWYNFNSVTKLLTYFLSLVILCFLCFTVASIASINLDFENRKHKEFSSYQPGTNTFCLSNKVIFYSDFEVLNFPSCLRSCTVLTWIIPLREWSFIMSILFRLREGCNMKHLDMQITNYSFDIKWGSSAYETSQPASLNCVSHT